MAYSSTDLANVTAAITNLVNGDRIVEITRDGVTTKYTATSLGELKALRREIQSEINVSTSSSATNPRTVVTLTRKGL